MTDAPAGDAASHFRTSATGSFLERDGAGRGHGRSNRKLCFTATDRAFLLALLLDLSRRPDCVYVKCARRPRDGMVLGRCFLTTDEAAARLWRDFHGHPRVMCALQDDDFLAPFRD